MNRKDAKKLAGIVTNTHLQQMFDNAKEGVKDWTKTSSVNKGMTKGTSWNILTKGFNVKGKLHIMAKVNMIREFGEFLTDEAKLPSLKNKVKINIKSVHQDPNF